MTIAQEPQTKFQLLLDEKIFTSYHIAKVAGVGQQMILRYARKISRPTIDPAVAIADLFGVDVKWLWTDKRVSIDDYETQREMYGEKKL